MPKPQLLRLPRSLSKLALHFCFPNPDSVRLAIDILPEKIWGFTSASKISSQRESSDSLAFDRTSFRPLADMRSTMLASIPSLVLPLLLFLLPQLVTATCYWQNSTLAPDDPYSIAPDDTACFPDQDNSPCCGTGWTCLSDGVCYINIDNGDYYYRGTCTDRTWNSQQCPGWCFSQSMRS